MLPFQGFEPFVRKLGSIHDQRLQALYGLYAKNYFGIRDVAVARKVHFNKPFGGNPFAASADRSRGISLLWRDIIGLEVFASMRSPQSTARRKQGEHGYAADAYDCQPSRCSFHEEALFLK
jgi:hypothetical protein